MYFTLIATIIFMIFSETCAFAAWIFWKLFDLAADTFCPAATQLRVQLPTGVAIGKWRFGHIFFDSIQYAEAERFKEARFLSDASCTNRVLNQKPECFPQALRGACLDSPIIPSLVDLWQAGRGAGIVGDENAFQLNIWVPRSASASASKHKSLPLPVLVYFHGGAHVLGQKNMSFSRGGPLCERGGVIVVSAAYRLGVLGYASAPGIVSNCGTRDQLLCLRWVQENIGRFGGDKRNVTVSGQSAGSMSSAALLSIDGVVGRPGSGGDGLVTKAFLMSGTAQHPQTKRQAAMVMSLFAKHAGMPFKGENGEGGTDAETRRLVEHLRHLPLSSLIKTQLEIEAEITLLYRRCQHDGLMPFQHTIDDDLFPENPTAMFRDKGTALPLLLGSTEHEYTFFTALSPSKKLAAKWHPIDDSKISTRLQQWLGCGSMDEKYHRNISKEQRDKLCNTVLEAYRAGGFEQRFNAHPLWNAVNGDFVFRYSVQRLAASNSENGGKSYVFCFSEPSGLSAGLQATHCIDLHYWFGTVARFPFLAGFPTPSRIALQTRAMDSLIEFLHRPAASLLQQHEEDHAETSALWKPWNPVEQPVCYFASNSKNRAEVRNNVDERCMRSWDDFFDVIEKDI